MRILHTMLRVGDMKRSVAFYTEVLGMKLLRTTDRPEQKYSLAFVGYGPEDGSAYGHVAIEVDDIRKACDRVRAQGCKVTREPGPVKGGTSVIAFVEDPDGYKIEFIERRN